MSDETRFYAHTIDGQPPEAWQLLDAHLRAVAQLAASFALPYDAGDWAYCAGLWHDIGNTRTNFRKGCVEVVSQ